MIQTIHYKENDFSYTVQDREVLITAVSPCIGEVEFPAVTEAGEAVCVIGRKCCLGAGRLTSVILPDSVRLVDDWAFAGCRRLKKVTMPRAALGMGVFQDCNSLREIALTEEGVGGSAEQATVNNIAVACGSAHTDDSGPADDNRGADEVAKDTASILAALALRRDAAYLTDLKEAGSREWYRRIDAWLEKLLEASDQEGYSGQVPCGEEDYGSSDVGAYESGRRREKCELALLRIIYPSELSEKLKERLDQYVLSHTAGSELGDESWQVILKRHPEEREWYEAFSRLGGVTDRNRDRILSEIPEEYVEMKSFIINTGGKNGAVGFLDGLAL